MPDMVTVGKAYIQLAYVATLMVNTMPEGVGRHASEIVRFNNFNGSASPWAAPEFNRHKDPILGEGGVHAKAWILFYADQMDVVMEYFNKRRRTMHWHCNNFDAGAALAVLLANTEE